MQVHVVPPKFYIQNGQITSPRGVGQTSPNPPPVQPQPTYAVYIDDRVHPVVQNGGWNQPSSPSYSYSSFVYDPMIDQIEWYAGSNYWSIANTGTRVSTYELDRKMWNRSELNTWLESHGTGHVFVQYETNQEWLLIFEQDADRYLFQNWWMSLTKKHAIRIDNDDEEDTYGGSLESKIKTWCVANLKDKFDIRRESRNVLLYVKDDEEAVHAKLALNGR